MSATVLDLVALRAAVQDLLAVQATDRLDRDTIYRTEHAVAVLEAVEGSVGPLIRGAIRRLLHHDARRSQAALAELAVLLKVRPEAAEASAGSIPAPAATGQTRLF